MGSIYKLTCSNPELVYYGSTSNTLGARFSQHKYHNSINYGCTSSKLFEFENVKIEELEKCNSHQQLKERENYYIGNNTCVNKLKPIVSLEDKKQRRKDYYEKNSDKNKAYAKEYYSLHKEDKRQYYLNKRESLLEKVQCECGKMVGKNYIKEHRLRSQHKKWLESPPNFK